MTKSLLNIEKEGEVIYESGLNLQVIYLVMYYLGFIMTIMEINGLSLKDNRV